MTDPINSQYNTAAIETYTGDAMAPLQELGNSALVQSFGNASLSANLGLSLNMAPDMASKGPQNSPGLNA
jgi:hypothetical protein